MKMQELVRFNYCPRCGSQSLQPKENKAMLCNACGLQYFHNPAAAVAGIIEQDGQVLLIKRGRDPQKGLLNFPGGFVDYAESLEAGLAREMREELDLVVTGQHYLTSDWDMYPYREVVYPTIVTFFAIAVADLARVKAGDDAEGFSFTPVGEIDPAQLAFKSSRTALYCYLEWRKHANFH
jgi:NADH pyrophosphatase NudC (nudix superfamily)